MSAYLGDFRTGKVVRKMWNSNAVAGESITRATNGTISVYKDGGTTQSTTGITDTEDFDGLTGVHLVAVDTSSDGSFYSAGSDFEVVLSGATIDGKAINATLFSFSIENRSALMPTTAGRTLDVSATGEADANVTQVLGNAVSLLSSAITADVTHFGGVPGTFSGGRPEVNTTHAAGTAWGSGAITAGAIASDAITAAKIASDALTAAKFAADCITAAKIADGAIDANTFAAGAITASAIAADAIGASELAADAAAEVATAVWAAGTRTLSALGFTLGASDLASDTITAAKIAPDAIGSSELASTAVAEIVAAVWNEVLTGSTYNAVNSAGRHLRLAAAGGNVTILTGTLQSGSTSNTAVLPTTASAVSNVYAGALLAITGGTGVGQTRTVVSYNGTTKVATLDKNWVTTPTASTFDLLASAGSPFADQGVAQAGAASTITLAATSSSTDDTYNDAIVTILSGTGSGQSRTIADYAGSTRVATVDSNWSTNPDATSAYAVIPSGAASGSPAPGPTAGEIAEAVWTDDARTLTAAANLSIPTTAQIADAVWEESIADHSGTAGSAAEALEVAGESGDPWTTALPGSYTSGQAGYILGTNLNATVSSRSSHSASDVWAVATRVLTAGTNIVLAKGTGVTGFNDITAASVWGVARSGNQSSGSFGEYIDAAISTAGGGGGGATAAEVWDYLTSDIDLADSIGTLIKTNLNATVSSRSSHSAADTWAVGTRTLTAGTNIVLAKGTGVTGFTDLDAAGVRAAVGLAAANLDAQLATIDAVADSILDDTGTAGVVVASGSKLGYKLAADGVDLVVIESGCNLRQAVSAIAATTAGECEGLDTTEPVYQGIGVATVRVSGVVDERGNRSSVSLNLPS